MIFNIIAPLTKDGDICAETFNGRTDPAIALDVAESSNAGGSHEGVLTVWHETVLCHDKSQLGEQTGLPDSFRPGPSWRI